VRAGIKLQKPHVNAFAFLRAAHRIWEPNAGSLLKLTLRIRKEHVPFTGERRLPESP